MGQHLDLLLFTTGLAVATALGAAPAQAQATRTWVSGVGDDANPCSRTAPCKTFAGAISKTAASGEINALDPGGFGAVTITKAITIDGGPGIAGVLVAGTNGIVVSAGPTDVVRLLNLDIDGTGTGINGVNFVSGQGLHVENTKIYNFSSSGISFTPSTNAALDVIGSTITDNAIVGSCSVAVGSCGGIRVAPGSGASAMVELTRVTLARNFYGLRAEDGGFVSVFNSAISNNTHNGVLAQFNGASQVNIYVKDSLVTGNGTHGVSANGASAAIYLTNAGLFQNAQNIFTTGGGLVTSFGNNQNVTTGTPGAPTGTTPQQ